MNKKYLDETGLSIYWGNAKKTFAKKEDVYTKTESDKKYATLDKIERANLINTIGEATASLSGIMSKEDKQRLDTLVALIGSNDSNQIVDNITEVLAIFNQYPEGADLVNALATKANKTDIPTKTSQLSNDSNFATTDQLFSGNYSDLNDAPEEALIVMRDYISNENGKEAKELELNGQFWNFPSGKAKLIESGRYQGEQEAGPYFTLPLQTLLENRKTYMVRVSFPEHGGASCNLLSPYFGSSNCILFDYEDDQQVLGYMEYTEVSGANNYKQGRIYFVNKTNQDTIYSECDYEIYELPFSYE